MVTREVLPATLYRLLVNKNKQASPLYLKDDLVKDRGDRIRCPYLYQLKRSPIKGVPIDGNEGTLQYDNYDVIVDKQSHAERREIDLSDQRVAFADQFREDMKGHIVNNWIETHEISLLNHMGGNSLGTDHSGETGFDGNNAISEPVAPYHLFSGAATAETGLVAGEVLSSANIRQAATLAETLRTTLDLPVIRRAALPVSSSAMWGLIISPRQRDHLIDETGTVGSFLDVQRAAMEGGETSDSQTILRGRYDNTTYQYIGQYAGVAIFVDAYTPFGNDGAGNALSDVDRSIFFGAGTGAVSFGKLSPDMERFQWRDEEFRYAEEYGVAAKSIWGCNVPTLSGGPGGEVQFRIVISSHAEDV